ncbi:MAG: hypothetical protein IJU23_09540 [Proteobacteria bacterium]|nr:hypothetical protein [Pseudomonadota bacterium]
MRYQYLAIVCAILLTACSTGVEAGRKALKSVNYDEAQKQAIAAIAMEPRNPEVYQLASAASYGRGQYDSAQKSAEFAVSLDGGSIESEMLVRRAAFARKKWADVCESGLRSTQAGHALQQDEREMFESAFNALDGKGEGYGCMKALEMYGITPENGDSIKAAYAKQLAKKGYVLDAYEIERTVSDPAVSQLSAAKRLFQLRRNDEARTLLREYVGNGGSEREKRIAEAATVCEEFSQWAFDAEILAESKDQNKEVRHAIALRRSFDIAESDKVLSAHNGRADRTIEDVIADVRLLCNAGYGDAAAASFALSCDNSTTCFDNRERIFEAAGLLYDAGQMSSASHILTTLGEKNPNDGALYVRIFEWFRNRKMPTQALVAAENAAKLGVNDDEFQTARLETFVDCREIRQFERVSQEWIGSFEAPAAKARETVAQIEKKRKNWAGVVEVLEPAAAAGKLSKDGQMLYFEGLKVTREFAKLYATFEKYDTGMSALKRSEYFRDAEAETEFRKTLEPLSKGSVSDKISAEMALASFCYELKGDEAESIAALERALELSGKTSNAYEVIFNYLKSVGNTEKAAEYAARWQAEHPDDKRCYLAQSRMFLGLERYDEVGKAFEEYVRLEDDKPKAYTFVFEEYGRYNAATKGVEWLENHLDSENPDQREILAASRVTTYLSRNKEKSVEVLRLAAIEDYRVLLDKKPENALKYAYAFYRVEAWQDSADAFEKAADRGLKFAADDRQSYVSVHVKAGRMHDGIRQIVSDVENDEEALKMASLLEKEHIMEYGEQRVLRLLDSETLATRQSAFSWLVRYYSGDGKTEQIREISDKFENSAPNNADVHIRLAEIALSMNDFDGALRHLSWLQALRPDSREIMGLEVKLARRAPDNVGAQTLVSSMQDSAEGIYRRLDWLSQIYEQYGDTQNALKYAKKAYSAAGPAISADLVMRLMVLELRSGNTSQKEVFDELTESLKSLNQWNSNNIVRIAEEAQKCGCYDQAQAWMHEAISLSPEDLSIKRRRLEMAIASESTGQIANSLEQAVSYPVAEVMEPLKDSGSLVDAFSAIELFEQNGEYAMAASSLISVLPYYVEANGVTATRRKLEDYSDNAPAYRSKAAEILAQSYLQGETPCDALAYTSDIVSGDVWASLLMRCPNAKESIYASMQSLRQGLISRNREKLDDDVYERLVLNGAGAMAEEYAEKMGLWHDTWQKFERLLRSGDVLAAIKQLAHEGVEPEKICDAAGLLASAGYGREAADYLRGEMSRVPDDQKVLASAIAWLLGAQEYSDNIRDSASLDGLTALEKADLLTKESVTRWLKSTPGSRMAAVLEVIMAYASANPAHRDAMIDAINAEIGSRSSKVSYYISAAQAASDAGLHEAARDWLLQVTSMQPASDFVWRSLSKEQAMLGMESEAWKSLEEGARCSSTLDDYWQRAWTMHQKSGVQVRRNINAARLELQPRNSEFLTEAVGIELELGQIERAGEMSKLAYESGRQGVVMAIVEAYERADALSSLPVEISSGAGSSALAAKARVLMAQSEDEAAAVNFSESAMQAPWPPNAYSDAIDRYLEKSQWLRVEQLTALWLKNYPHSAPAYATRAVLAIEQGNAENAWQDYLKARELSFSSDTWIGRIIRNAALNDRREFARKVYEFEQNHGSLKSEIWLNEILDAYLDDKNLGSDGKISREFATQGMRFIDDVIPGSVIVLMNNRQLRAEYEQLKSRTKDGI